MALGRKYIVSGKVLLISALPFIAISAFSCEKQDPYFAEVEIAPLILDTISVSAKETHPYNVWTEDDDITISQYASLGFSHQSAAAYGDYAFFVNNGRSQILLYNLNKKEKLFSLSLKGVSGNTYHCNQCSFGVDKYDPEDYFPLMYLSQRAKSDGRCFIEVYRVFPLYNEDLSDYESFAIELVQTIYLPAMSYDNSLGNANCAIDAERHRMVTYSRNNNSKEDNYGQCKITEFPIPDLYQKTVILNDSDILSSFMLGVSAVNMQGGCIKGGILYIGQGYASAGYIYLNIVDLRNKALIRRFDIQKYKVSWEPEGCFFYDGSVMLAHTSDISRIDKN